MELNDAVRNFFIGLGAFIVGLILSFAATSDDGSGLIFTGLLSVGGVFMAISILQVFIILYVGFEWKGRIILTSCLISIAGCIGIGANQYFSPENVNNRENSSAGIIWEKHLKSDYKGITRATALTTNGEILFGGSYSSPKNGKEGYFGILDQDGKLLWDRSISGNGDEEITSISILDDGGAILTGFSSSDSLGKHDGIVLKISHSGEILWQKRFGGKNEDWLDKSLILPNGDILIAGYTSSKGDATGDGFLVRIGSDGELIWEKTYGGKYKEVLYSLSMVGSEAIIVAGESRSNNQKNPDLYYAKINFDGELDWEYFVGNDGNDAALVTIPFKNENVLIGGVMSYAGDKKGNMFFGQINSDGDIVTDNSYSVSESRNEKIFSLAVMPDDNILLGGFAYYDDTRFHNLALIKVDAKGNSISDHRFKPNQNGRINSINILPNGEVILAGYSSMGSNKNNMYIMKTNAVQ